MDTSQSRLQDRPRRSRRHDAAHQPLTWALVGTAACVAVLAMWTATGSAGDARYMTVNLVLAWIPVVMAYALALVARAPVPRIALIVAGAIWLLFLPNAPYLLTDIVHVHNFSNRSPGLIAGGLGALAVTGIALYVTSVATVCAAAERRVSARTARWIPAVCAWTAAVGMYCGRFLRWNSWDVLARPLALAGRATAHVDSAAAAMTAVGFIVICALMLLVSYGLLSGGSWSDPAEPGRQGGVGRRN